jgi:phosphonatase-like hydrolase
MSQQIELVVFDIAGTTVKDEGEIAAAFQKAMEIYGHTVAVEKINALMGYKKNEAIRMLLEEYEANGDKTTQEHIDNIHSHFLQEMLQHYSTVPELHPLPNAEKVFGHLQKLNIKIGLTTGFSKEITDVIMDRLGWTKNNIVNAVVSSNEVTAGRPHPYMIEELMHRTSVSDASKIIKVGDTEVDVHEGKNAGCRFSIGVTTGAFTRSELEKHHPSFIIDDLEELISIIETHS